MVGIWFASVGETLHSEDSPGWPPHCVLLSELVPPETIVGAGHVAVFSIYGGDDGVCCLAIVDAVIRLRNFDYILGVPEGFPVLPCEVVSRVGL